MAIEQAQMRTADGVAALASYWYGIDLRERDAERIAKAGRYYDDPKIRGRGCLDVSANLCLGAVLWLKTRLVEFGLLPAGHEGCPEIRLTCELHFEPLIVAPTEIRDWLQPLNYARSRLSRSPLARIAPIDQVAARLTRLHDESACPYCRRWYRNGAALRLHVVESHGVTA